MRVLNERGFYLSAAKYPPFIKGYFFPHFQFEVRLLNECGLYLSAGTFRDGTVCHLVLGNKNVNDTPPPGPPNRAKIKKYFFGLKKFLTKFFKNTSLFL